MSCKTINIDLANVPHVPLQIGVAGENAFRTITFDASKWGADYPDATYTVVYRRSDGYLYPVLVNASADAIVWNPTGTDTAVSGNGQLEVRLLDGETIGKTIIMQTYVAPSLSGDESEPSTPAPDWVNDVADDADRAEAAVSHYPQIVNGVWFVWDAEQSKFVSTGISAQGEDGVSPTVTVEAIEGGHRVTITDADGAHTFDVMDGEGGSGGGAVESVNGMTGAVVLDADDVGALPNTYVAPVQSVNGQTGAVNLDASDVGALPDSTVIPTVPQMATQANMSDWTSGKTVDAATLKTTVAGAALKVVGLEDDVSALERDKANASDIPTAVSQLNNDSGYQTASDVQTAIDPFVIPITVNEDNWTTTASAADIVDHADNCVLTVYGANYAPQAVTKYEQTANIQTVLCMIQYGMLISQNIAVYADKSNNSITISGELERANLLPTVTASDNGKFLRVVNGAWAAATVPSAESNSFGGGA